MEKEKVKVNVYGPVNIDRIRQKISKDELLKQAGVKLKKHSYSTEQAHLYYIEAETYSSLAKLLDELLRLWYVYEGSGCLCSDLKIAFSVEDSSTEFETILERLIYKLGTCTNETEARTMSAYCGLLYKSTFWRIFKMYEAFIEQDYI